MEVPGPQWCAGILEQLRYDFDAHQSVPNKSGTRESIKPVTGSSASFALFMAFRNQQEVFLLHRKQWIPIELEQISKEIELALWYQWVPVNLQNRGSVSGFWWLDPTSSHPLVKWLEVVIFATRIYLLVLGRQGGPWISRNIFCQPSGFSGWWLSPAPLKNMSSSIGMITFPIYCIWKNHPFMFQSPPTR